MPSILAHKWQFWDFRLFDFPVLIIAHTAIWFMVALSLISAFDYFKGFWTKIDKQVVRSRKRRVFVLNRRRKNNDVPAT